jgi:hypothetical protein
VHYACIACRTPVSLQFQSIDHDFESYGPNVAIDLRGPAIWIHDKIAAILTNEAWRRPGSRTDWDTITLSEMPAS